MVAALLRIIEKMIINKKRGPYQELKPILKLIPLHVWTQISILR